MRLKVNLNMRIKYDRLRIWAMYIPICTLMVQLFLYKITSMLDLVSMNGLIHGVMMFISALAMLISAFTWIKTYHSFAVALFTYTIVGFIYIIQYLYFPENISYLTSYVFDIFFISVPLFINSVLIKKDEGIEIDILRKAGWIIFSAGIVLMMIEIFMGLYTGYSMSYGYYMLLPACGFAYIYYDSKKRLYLLLSILAAASIFILGSRGPIAVWAFYFTVLLLRSKTAKKGKMFLIFILIMVVVFKKYIFKLSAFLLNAAGIKSRTLSLLSTGQMISHDSGRGVIYAKSFEMIAKHLFTGNGIGADIRVIETYPHNLFIEVLLHFGVVIGGLFLIGLIFIIAKGFINSTNKNLYLFYFTIGFLPLMLSGTYLTRIEFWLFLGYLLRNSKVNVFTAKEYVSQ